MTPPFLRLQLACHSESPRKCVKIRPLAMSFAVADFSGGVKNLKAGGDFCPSLPLLQTRRAPLRSAHFTREIPSFASQKFQSGGQRSGVRCQACGRYPLRSLPSIIDFLN